MARKITSLYYLSYPNCSPANPLDAATEAYVEIGGPDSTSDHFEETFAFQIYTLGYLQRVIQREGRRFAVDRSVIIVDRLDDELIREAIESILDYIENLGQPK